MTLRIGWGDKPSVLREIAAELGFATAAIVFIDDSAREREQVRAELPEVEVWGEDLYRFAPPAARRPRLQRAAHHRRGGGARRTREGAAFARAAARRRRRRGGFPRLARLVCEVFAPRRGRPAAHRRMFARTTQFNAAGAEIQRRRMQAATVLAMRVKDRLADHGLVGAAVVRDGEIGVSR